VFSGHVRGVSTVLHSVLYFRDRFSPFLILSGPPRDCGKNVSKATRFVEADSTLRGVSRGNQHAGCADKRVRRPQLPGQQGGRRATIDRVVEQQLRAHGPRDEPMVDRRPWRSSDHHRRHLHQPQSCRYDRDTATTKD